jgi:Trk K+ transport system NAD-binding subunit
VLIFQDLWAIVFLGVQPNLANPAVVNILWSFGRGAILVVISLILSKYVLGRIFYAIAQLPELVLVASLGWCFMICALAGTFDLSLEMGALIAGAAISTFPYNLDVIGKIVSIRDFFLTLFFVALGMTIPNPMDNLMLVGLAAVTSVFVVFSRFVSLFPILWRLGNGNRVSLLVPINLSQISEFSLIIASLGVTKGHITQEILSSVIFTFAITSTISTYMIQYSHTLQDLLNRAIQAIGIRDLSAQEIAAHHVPQEKEIAIVGFHRVASSFVTELESSPEELRHKLLVIDFNPEVFQKLTAMGIKTVYGDIGNIETLRNAGIGGVKVIISTISDTMLKGTDNLKIIIKLRKLNPHARIIVSAESPARANRMYNAGADYVLLPRMLTAWHLLEVVQAVEDGTIDERKTQAMEKIKARQEIVS